MTTGLLPAAQYELPVDELERLEAIDAQDLATAPLATCERCCAKTPVLTGFESCDCCGYGLDR